MVHHADTTPRTELHLSSVRLPPPVPLWSQHFGELKFLLASLQSVSCEKSPESSIHLSRCVLMFTPLIPPVATVESPPQNDDLSNNTTLPSFPNTVLAVDIPAQPPANNDGLATVRLLKNSLHPQVPREKWPSCCRPTRTWHKLLFPRGRKPRNPEENYHLLSCCVEP